MKKQVHIGLYLQGGHSWLGGFEYIKSILISLAAVAGTSEPAFRLTLITENPLNASLQAQIATLVDRTICLFDESAAPTIAQRLKRKILREVFRRDVILLPKVIRREKIDFVYPYTPENEGRHGFAFASWIADFQHKGLPEFFSNQEILFRDKRFERAARLSPCVVLSSRDAEQDFRHHYPYAAQRSRVFPFRTPCQDWWYTDDPRKLQHDYQLPDKFFLVANQFWKHKNHVLVFRAIRELVEQGIQPTVVFTGNIHDGRFPEYTDVILQTVQQLGIHPYVRLLGVVSREHYVQLLRRSIAAIQPSLFEGWSTIVEDCRSLGKPMILSDLAVNREQDPPGAIFFARASEAELTSRMREFWDRLTPGPDPAAEEEARQANIQNVKTQGTQFLAIASEASRVRGW